MSVMPILWIVWAVVVAILLMLLGYRGTLTRYEEDQIFLADSGNHEAQEQGAILLKLQQIRPYVQTAVGAMCVLSACILGMYVWDAIQRLS
jgi:hypothetical protein